MFDDVFTCGLCLSECDISLEKLPCKHNICNHCYTSLSKIMCPKCNREYQSIKQYDEYYNISQDIDKFRFKYRHLIDDKIDKFLKNIYERLYNNSTLTKDIILVDIHNDVNTEKSINIPIENLSNYSKTI
jgi:hypothetical protein